VKRESWTPKVFLNTQICDGGVSITREIINTDLYLRLLASLEVNFARWAWSMKVFKRLMFKGSQNYLFC
jgi:hypothetical protein